MPKARRAIMGASFEPATSRMLGEVLEEVWASVAPEFENDAQTIERGRTRLAPIIIDLARDHQLNALQIAKIAARLMRETVSSGERGSGG
jgi:hypothetical protein